MTVARYPVECLIRPLVEMPAAVVSLAASIAIGLMPDVFWLPSSLTQASDYWRVLPPGHWLITGALFANGMKRLHQSYRVAQYQSRLRRLPRYEVVGDDIPARDNALFLGKAFAWDERHTRRVVEASRDAAKDFLNPHWSDRFFARGKPASSGDEGGKSYLHGVGLWEKHAEQELWISEADRMGHILVEGTTGVGKSRLLELLMVQDIKSGGPVIVFDPKGDLAVLLQAYAAACAAGRKDDFICFHLAFPEMSARYNLFGSFARITEIANRVREALPDTGNSAAFAEFAWSYVNTIAVGLHALGRRTTVESLLSNANNLEGLVADYVEQLLDKKAEGWKLGFDELCADIAKQQSKGALPRHELDKTPRSLALVRLVQKYKIVDSIAERLLKTFSYDRSYHDKLVSSLYPLLQKMNTGKVAEILSPNYDDVNDTRPILDFEQALRANKIIYIGLDALTDGTVAKAVAGSMLSDLTSLAGRIYNYTRAQGLSDGIARNHKRVKLHVDELGEMATDALVPLANKSRGAGFDFTGYTQSAADLVVGMGSEAKGQQLIDNFNTLIMMRVKSEATCKLLTDGLSEVVVPTITWGSGSTDSGSGSLDFTSNQTQKITETRVKLVTPAQIISLPRGQAFISTQGGRLYKAVFPMPLESRQSGIPRTVQELGKALLSRYAAPQAPWQNELAPWRDAPADSPNETGTSETPQKEAA